VSMTAGPAITWTSPGGRCGLAATDSAIQVAEIRGASEQRSARTAQVRKRAAQLATTEIGRMVAEDASSRPQRPP
jgi:hypothetical protein